MHIKQYYLACLSHASYMITDDKTKTAVVVDPQRDVDIYIRDAQAGGYTIRHVFLTHFHADFVAGHIELRERVGASLHLGSRASAEFSFVAARDGDTLDFGDTRITVLETPGHTPEGISLLVTDLSRDPSEPVAVLTGDTLFIGDVGRPDLMASVGVSADALAEMLYDSVTKKLLPLPDSVKVYPAHGAGSLCGKSLSTETVSTMGEQRKTNYALAPMSLESFKTLVTADQPEAPSYFGYDAMLNRQERASLESVVQRSRQALTLDEVQRLAAEGAQIIDVRGAAQYEEGHLTGSVNIGLDGKFATWCGFVLDRDRPIVVIADPGAEVEAITRLGRIGFDLVAGYLEGGPQALDGHPAYLSRIARVTAAALDTDVREAAGSGREPIVVDVRSAAEHARGHLPGSLNLPLPHLAEQAERLPQGRPVVVHCEGGYRSAVAASLLRRAGRDDVRDLIGGFKAWQASGLPVVSDEVTAVSS